MGSWWDAACDALDGGTPGEYLESHWRTDTDRDIGAALAKATGRAVTSSAVSLKRYRAGLLKDRQGRPADEPKRKAERREGAAWSEDGNYAEAVSFDPRIKGIDDLIRATGADVSVWECIEWKPNKWEVGAKVKRGELEFEASQMSGWITYDGLVVEPLWQVKATFVRKKPVAVKPVVRPIACDALPYEPADVEVGDRVRALVWSDPQFGYVMNGGGGLEPFHNERALDVVLALAEACEPDRVDCLGDVMDLASFSQKFVRSPAFVRCTQPALDAAHQFGRQLREVVGPSVLMRWHEGNHDARMGTALAVHLPDAFDLARAGVSVRYPALSVPSLLNLEALGIEYVDGWPGDLDWVNDGLVFRHGELAGLDAIRKVARYADVSEVFGHTHRLEMAVDTRHGKKGQRCVSAYSVGCTCRLDGVVPSRKARDQWQNGVAVVDYEVGGEWFAVAPVLIDPRGCAVWNGLVLRV